MRALMVSALAMTALAAAAPAAAQQTTLDGVWAFQSDPYGDERFVVLMSGAAVFARASHARTPIQLTSNEIIVERASGRSRVITVHQSCQGESDGAQITITCQMAEPLEGYTPDAFLLQPGEDGGLIGVLNANTQVQFARVR